MLDSCREVLNAKETRIRQQTKDWTVVHETESNQYSAPRYARSGDTERNMGPRNAVYARRRSKTVMHVN